MTQTSIVRGWQARTAVAVASIAMVAGALAGAPVASAASVTISGPSTGTVWSPLTYTVTTNDTSGSATYSLVNASNGATLASVGSWQCTSSSCQGQATWTPNTPGSTTVQISATDGSQSPTIAVSVTTVPTTTTVSAPNLAKAGQATNVTVTVQSAPPSSLQPLGNAVFFLNGTQVASVALQRGAATSQGVATYSWTPANTGTFTWTASYVPANGANANASQTTAGDQVQVTSTGSLLSLQLPPTFNVNTPATLYAQVSATPSAGTVTFSINGQAITAPQQVNAQGQTGTTWTPTVAGSVKISALWQGANGQTATTTDTVTVGSATQADVVTLTQAGYGNWVPGGTYTLAPNSTTTFSATTLSGAPAVLSANGICSISGMTLTVTGTSGTCGVNAVTAGGNGYSGANQRYTVTVGGGGGAQDASLSWPNNRRIPSGRTVTLATPGERTTNAGALVTFRVTTAAGRRACTLINLADGTVNLRKRSSGRCTVVASAPATGGFSAYREQRTYR